MASSEILRHYPFLGELFNASTKAIAMISEDLSSVKGAVIREEDQPAKVLYLQLEGGVSLYYKTEEDFHATTRKNFLLGEISPGEVIAISGWVQPNKYPVTIKAEQDSKAKRVDAEAVHGVIEKDPSLNCVLMHKIAKHLMSDSLMPACSWQLPGQNKVYQIHEERILWLLKKILSKGRYLP